MKQSNPNKAFETTLKNKLDERKRDNLFRELQISDDKIDFSSNDYLGFSKFQKLHISTDLTKNGATGSRLISGNSQQAEQAESFIASYHGFESALIFNCGYMANVGLFSCIAQKGDTIITDEYIHASIIDGIRMSNAKRLKFKHNNLEDLEKKLSHCHAESNKRHAELVEALKTSHPEPVEGQTNIFVAVESIYSMDGDEAPLQQLAELCTKYNALLIVDEAHAVGVFGENGEGLVSQQHLQSQVFACVYTYGKALGLHGAAVCGSETLRNYLINFARPFIYSTALPPYAYQQIAIAYQLLVTTEREKLFNIISYYKAKSSQLKKYKLLPSNSTIQGIVIGNKLEAKKLSEHLFSNEIYAKAILSPTVPIGTERLRICLHSFNTEKEIDLLIEEINKFTI